MPYSLNFASGGTVSFTPKALMGTWAWEIELEIPDTSNQRVINFNNNNFRYLRADGGFWELRNNLAGLPNVTSTTAAVTNTRTVIRVEATADEVSWFIDGTPQGVVGTQTNDFILNNLNNTANFTGKVYRFEVWENGMLVESRIKQTLTSGNDRVYTDNVGTNDGALDATFPADNSQWELFDAAAGVTSDVAYTVNTPSVSASAGATALAPQSDIAFSVSAPSVSVSATASLPQPVSDIAFTVNTPSVAASASSTIPDGKWLLSFDGTDDYVEADIDTLVQPFSATLDIYITDGANSASRFLSIANASGDYIGIGASSGEWKIYSHGVTPGSAGSIQFNERLTVELAVSSSSASVTVNGVEIYSVTPTETTFLNTLNKLIIGAAPDYTFNSQIDLYGVTISSGGATVNDYDPSLSGGIGQTLYDSVNSQNGTLNNFPNDNSQWVVYSDSVSADVSLAVSAPSVAVSASATMPGYNATVSFTVSTPSASVNASATLPNPSADVSYAVSAPTISALASATLPNPVSDVAFSVSAPSVSVSAAATEPNFNSNVAFTVSAPTVSISASATLPQPESAVSFTVSPPSVSVVAIVGGIAIIVDEETNINQRVLSNNINAPILSNNING